MCGRYASVRKRTELLEEFGVLRDRVAQPLEPDYNVAPTKPIYAVLTRRAGDDRDAAGDGAPGGAAGQAGAEEAAQRQRASSGWSAGGWCRSGPRTSRSAAS